MANELQARMSFAYEKSVDKVGKDLESFYLTIAGSGRYGPTLWNVGTSEEDMSFGDVATPGFLLLRNTDLTNYVTWGKKVAGAMEAVGILKPNVSTTVLALPTVLYLASTVTIRAQANTAACLVEAWVLPA
jgi:hypothetical protein